MSGEEACDAAFQFGGMSLFKPSRLACGSKRPRVYTEGAAVAEAEGQREVQDDAVAVVSTPMKKLKPNDFADKPAFQKEQRRMTSVRKAEKEAFATRQAAASLASAKEAKEFKNWQCHRLLEGHDWLLHLCAKVDKLNEHGAWSAGRTSRDILWATTSGSGGMRSACLTMRRSSAFFLSTSTWIVRLVNNGVRVQTLKKRRASWAAIIN
jgi:hypothetical protein